MALALLCFGLTYVVLSLYIWATKGISINLTFTLCFGLFQEFYEEQPQKRLLSGAKLSKASPIMLLSIPHIRAHVRSLFFRPGPLVIARPLCFVLFPFVSLMPESVDLYVMLNCSNWIYFFFFSFLPHHLPHMGVPRLGVNSELQLPAWASATTTLDSYSSLWQCRIHWPRLGREPSSSQRVCWALNLLSYRGTPLNLLFFIACFGPEKFEVVYINTSSFLRWNISGS